MKIKFVRSSSTDALKTSPRIQLAEGVWANIRWEYDITDDRMWNFLRSGTAPAMHPVPDSLLVPVKSDVVNGFDKLNDDCVRQIFAVYANVADLLELANVCERFKRIATDVFGKKHQESKGRALDDFKYPLWYFERLVRTFGASIISTSGLMLDDVQAALVSAYCPNIVKLKCFIQEQQSMVELHQLFIRLKKLSIRSTEPLSMGDWSGDVVQLHSLAINLNEQHIVKLPRGEFPTLKALHLGNVRLTKSDKFFQQNPLLRSISFDRCTGLPRSGRQGYFGKALHTVKFCDVDTAMLEMALVDFVARKTPVENLSVHATDNSAEIAGDRIFNAIRSIKSLRCLDLKNVCFELKPLHGIANRLTELKFWTTDQDTLDHIPIMMKKAGNLKKLVYGYEVRYDEDACLDPDPFGNMLLRKMEKIARVRGIDLQVHLYLNEYGIEHHDVRSRSIKYYQFLVSMSFDGVQKQSPEK